MAACGRPSSFYGRTTRPRQLRRSLPVKFRQAAAWGDRPPVHTQRISCSAETFGRVCSQGQSDHFGEGLPLPGLGGGGAVPKRRADLRLQRGFWGMAAEAGRELQVRKLWPQSGVSSGREASHLSAQSPQGRCPSQSRLSPTCQARPAASPRDPGPQRAQCTPRRLLSLYSPRGDHPSSPHGRR